MLRSLKIENFRCFPQLELQPLGRLNLLVGQNNSGKTSVLEAVQILNSRWNLEVFREILIRRGEVLNDNQESDRELDIRHFFYGREFDLGSHFSILGGYGDRHKEEGITVSIEAEQLILPGFENLNKRGLRLNIKLQSEIYGGIDGKIEIREYLPFDYTKFIHKDLEHLDPKTQFLISSSFTIEQMIQLFDQVVLNPEEDLVIEALQIIEPTIDRIAPIKQKYGSHDLHSGFIVRLANRKDQRIPIGSMGDGIWRMLGLALAIVNAKDGVLLVDEIDTGLHFTTMSDMWKLVWETAKRLNVQVFATTHNSDCWTSLATLANLENPSEDGITIHRIEKGKPKSIVFTERQIAIAAEEGIEVR